MTVNDDRVNTLADDSAPSCRGGSRKRLGMMLCAAGILVLCFATRFSPAQTAMELLRWKEFSSVKRVSQLGGKIAGLHAIDRAGFVVLSDGGFAQLSSSTVHTNSQEGKAFFQGFVMYDFKDGSSILAKVDVSGEHNGKQIGTITFLSGTKRFKGITGRGTLSAWMPAEWDMYTEVEASYSVTAK
jgi:hypothetical protein